VLVVVGVVVLWLLLDPIFALLGAFFGAFKKGR
jgi:hypothetical protein